MNRSILCFVFVMLLCLAEPAHANSDFKLVKKDNYVTLYERWIDNNKGESVRELKAVVVAKTTTNEILEQLANTNKGKVWNVNASEYKVQGRYTDSYWITYTRYDIPWPFEDQDCVLRHYISNRTDNSVEISFEEDGHPQFPAHEGVTRITGTKGKWILKTEGDAVRITYYITTDRSKKVPKWCSDMVVHNNMFKTLTALQRVLEK